MTRKWAQTWPVVALIGVTVIAYLPVLRAGFIWDDDAHITAATDVLDVAGLGRIWTRLGLENGGSPQYYPLTNTMFWVEHHLWGHQPLGYHLINLLLHALSACLLWRILRTLNVSAAWVIAAVWAIHPMNVESVAWASERKNVLSGVLFFSSILAYLQTMREGCAANHVRKWWGISLGLFVLALLSKTTVSVLPAVLLLILWWKKKLSSSPSPGTPGEGRGEGRTVRLKSAQLAGERGGPHPNPLPEYRARGPIHWQKRRLSWTRVAALIPFFVVGAGLGLLTAHVERRYVAAVGPDWDFTFGQRVRIAGQAIWFYARQLLLPWPGHLCFSYPRWNLSTELSWGYPLAAAVAVLVAMGTRLVSANRSVTAAVLYFIGALVPALGFFNVYPMRFSFVADHFVYLASVGFIGLIIGGIHAGSIQAKLPRGVVVAASCLLLLFLGIGTWQRSEEFHDSATLWRDTIAKNPDSWLAKYNLATELIRTAREESRQAAAVTDPEQAKRLQAAAIADYIESSNLLHDVLQLQPQHEYAHFALGVIAQLTNRPADAVREFTTEIAIEPNYAPTYSNLGMTALSQNRLEDAKGLLTRAVELDSLPPHGRFLPVKSPVTRQALEKVNQRLAVQRAGDAATQATK